MLLPPHLLLHSYAEGLFPMAESDGTLYWYDPDPRAIIPLDTFHVPRRLARTVRQEPFEIRVDSAFREVMEGCADRPSTWISSELIESYCTLFHYGFAHCVETWQEGQLVGGIYGVSLGGFFAGESMFSRVRDASKVALVHLVRRLHAGGYTLFDVQFTNPHLDQFGVMEIPRAQYKARLAEALRVKSHFATS